MRLIIAHAGIADMAGLAGHFGGVPGVYFDTSVWSAVDLLDLFRQVAPQQVLFATDYPYGRLPNALLLALRVARLAGLDEAEIRGMLGGTAAGDRARRVPLPALTRRRAASRALVSRSRSRGSSSTSRWRRRCSGCASPTAAGGLGLAVNAALEDNDHVAGGARSIRHALADAAELWGPRTARSTTSHERRRVGDQREWLVHIADILAATTRA